MPSRKRSAMSSTEAPSPKKQRDNRALQRSAARNQAYRKQALQVQALRDQALLDGTLRKKSDVARVSHQEGFRQNMQVSSSTIHIQQLIRRFSTELNAVNSPILCLPAELRNIIYDYVFESDHYLFDQYFFTGMRPDGERLLCSGSFLRKDLALLLTSRQLHAEAALHPYKLGFFDFRFEEPAFYEDQWHEGVLQRFLQDRSRKQIGAIARMEVSTHNMYGTSSDKTQNGVDWAIEMSVW